MGMHADTGKTLEGLAHVRQSVRDILTTPLGSRVMRREYGSRLYDLQDQPTAPATLTALQAGAISALRQHEPRLQVQQVQAESLRPGRITLTVEGRYRPTGESIRLEGIEL